VLGWDLIMWDAANISDTDTLMDLFTKSLENFGDKFYIKHTPMQIQEGSSNILKGNYWESNVFTNLLQQMPKLFFSPPATLVAPFPPQSVK